jgi:hypothetical protein
MGSLVSTVSCRQQLSSWQVSGSLSAQEGASGKTGTMAAGPASSCPERPPSSRPTRLSDPATPPLPAPPPGTLLGSALPVLPPAAGPALALTGSALVREPPSPSLRTGALCSDVAQPSSVHSEQRAVSRSMRRMLLVPLIRSKRSAAPLRHGQRSLAAGNDPSPEKLALFRRRAVSSLPAVRQRAARALRTDAPPRSFRGAGVAAPPARPPAAQPASRRTHMCPIGLAVATPSDHAPPA